MVAESLGGVLGLWFVALSCSVSAILVAWGAMKGVIQHRIPRILVAVSVMIISVSYWVDLAGYDGAEMRRGAAFLLWPALGWTAWSGVVYSRSFVAEVQGVIESSKHDDP